ILDTAPPPDLVLTDMVMPGMGGRELANRVRERYPRMPIVLMSGYTDDELFRNGTRLEGSEFLEKPLTVPSLLRTVDSLLSGERSDVPGYTPVDQ
ncbi:MAG: response regulator, partial [Planctomycetota bacterium]